MVLDPDVAEIFRTAEEKRLFELLRSAYVDARYKRSYAITRDELQWLSARVEKLQALAEEKCKAKIESYRSK